MTAASSLRTLAAAAVAFALAGCTSFEPLRISRFIDDSGRMVGVEYGREEHETTFIAPSGRELPYKTDMKVRVTLPDGDDFVAYRHMSTVGVLYKTDDLEWEYLEEGVACVIAQMDTDGKGYLVRFQGVLASTKEGPAARKRNGRSSSVPVTGGDKDKDKYKVP